ncbi:carbohydrate kinase family protein [Neobacillus cucumis]|uniref:carbohydrate kinase family protein n=1 Tax=Neobacillus cucumis TaxID=1740721 RepID=UPI002853135D|nr:carbohydrate kinase [Neobacillus cucumis]MDR4949648.1 carbohydrate kinase [Neobacillus cucumis]
MYDITALGEVLIDFTPSGYSANGGILFEQNPGGAPANVLAVLSKFQKRTRFIGKVGNDQFGVFLKNTLQQINVDTAGLVTSNQTNTTLAFVHLDPTGDRTFSFYRDPGADTTLEIEEVNFDTIKDSRIFHFGSLSLTHHPSCETTLAAASFAKENGVLISFDPNLRESLWGNLNHAKEMMFKGLQLSDVVKISEEELVFLTGNSDLEKGSKWICDTYQVSLLFITLGGNGCYFRCGERMGIVPGYEVNVMDTTGAGDGFLGGVLYQILEKNCKIDSLSEDELIEIASFANAVGALATTKRGAILSMPTLDETTALITSKIKENV